MAQAVQRPRHPQYHDDKNHGDHHQNQKVAWLHLTLFDNWDLVQLAPLESKQMKVTHLNIMNEKHRCMLHAQHIIQWHHPTDHVTTTSSGSNQYCFSYAVFKKSSHLLFSILHAAVQILKTSGWRSGSEGPLHPCLGRLKHATTEQLGSVLTVPACC